MISRDEKKKHVYEPFYLGGLAALLMSATYSTSRFAFYGFSKEYLLKRSNDRSDISFTQKLIICTMGGVVGSTFGTPADLVNIRMQNDIKLPLDSRRNYKNCFEAFYRIIKYEGFLSLYTGYSIAVIRAVLATIGQLAFYDEFKSKLINAHKFKDNLFCHFLSSMGSGLITTLITMPVDVIKTLLMNAKPGEYNGAFDVAKKVLKTDKLGLLKGFFPRYIRIAPFTTCTFILYEQLKLILKNG